ncbi:MAG TPA: ABC transporter permease [Telluria sp.]|nr:ABC transporter permease [Telluria sp.]
MFRNYLLTAWKVFTRRKLYTAINLTCIVLTLVVLLVVTALLEYAFFPGGVERKSDRMLQVSSLTLTNADHTATHRSPIGYKIVDRYLRTIPGVEAVAAVSSPQSVSVFREGQISQAVMRRADAAYWQILDFNVVRGALPTAGDVAQGRFVAVLNESTARRLYGSVDVVGQTLNAAGQAFRIIGVVENVLHVNAYADIWVPVTTYPSTAYRQSLDGSFSGLLLVRDTGDLPRVQRAIASAARTVQSDDPKEWTKAYFWGDSKLEMFARGLLGNDQQQDAGATELLALIGGAMLIFMLLPALNLVNLNVGRIMERSAEIGVRKAFGATNRQLVVQFIVENVLLSLAGGVLGLLLAQGVLMWLNAADIIPYLKLNINLTVFALGLVIAAVFGVLSGVIPAWKMARLDPVHALKGVS